MKKGKKVFFLIFILILITINVIVIFFICRKIFNFEVKEVSILIEDLNVESDYYNVVISDENSDGNNGQNSNIQNLNGGAGYGANTGLGSNSAYGYGTTVEVVSYNARIRIPRTGINYTIYPQMSVQNMEKGVVILSSDNGLNQPGNTVISGHNTVNGRLFSGNSKIQIGDLIYISDPSGLEIKYSVYKKYLTNPNDASYVERDTLGRREISLTTCTNNSKQRIIIWAREI